MARPVARRRGGSSDDEAPSADTYTSRRGRGGDDEPADEDRRPRRGRGELPSRGRGRDDEPEEPTSRRGRSRDPEPEEERTQEGTLIPTTEKELEDVSDEDYDDLLRHFDVDEGLSQADEFVALWEAIEKSREPEEPRSRRGRGSDDEDEPRSRRGRSSRDDESADEPRGRRGRSSRDDDDKDEPRGRGRGDDEDRPKRTVRAGFSGFKRTREEHGGFDDFKLTDEEVLVKFLDDEPFAAYAEHGLYRELKDGQRVWNCLQPDEDCPVCNVGHDARPIGLWNVVVIPEEGKPQLKVLKSGPKLTKILESKSKLKTGPLTTEYYGMSQTEGKNNGPVEYIVDVYRERDVKKDWKIDPLSDKELDAFDEKKNDSSYVKFPTQKEMKDIARQLRDRD